MENDEEKKDGEKKKISVKEIERNLLEYVLPDENFFCQGKKGINDSEAEELHRLFKLNEKSSPVKLTNIVGCNQNEQMNEQAFLQPYMWSPEECKEMVESFKITMTALELKISHI